MVGKSLRSEARGRKSEEKRSPEILRVCKKDCVNPLEWNRRMEGREDEI
ncbi:hypothetical protein M388_00460 [Mesotoga sp. Brook.08.YT.4.2.5.4.]|nr:hypothetical protein M388_00460 [Mesotoga sp. Brook.08.YT.4.2.5.4.]